MGFKSVMKKVGKVALKVAPYAAGFIPGVGPLAAMAIGGLASGASKKLEGGSWKDAAMSGGLGAATGFGSGLAGKAVKGAFGAAKGIGPSANVASKAAGAAKGASTLGKVSSIMGAVPLGLGAAGAASSAFGGGGGGGSAPVKASGPLAGSAGGGGGSFADALRMGSRGAVKDQPFRKGYDVITSNADDVEEGVEPTITTRKMGPITSSYAKFARGQNRRTA